MSARQVFIPRSSSCAPPAEISRPMDEDRNNLTNDNGKARSFAAFLGRKGGTGADAASQGARTIQGPALGQANTSAHRRSFEAIRRPEMTPMSIIPFPAAAQQHGAGQTPRKTVQQGSFEFAKPMTPASLQKGPKKGFGIFSRGQDGATTPDGNAHGAVHGDDDEAHSGTDSEIAEYMRTFEGSRSVGGIQSTSERNIVAPVPERVLAGLATDVGNLADNIFYHPSRMLEAMGETESVTEKQGNRQGNFGAAKRGLHPEEVEENGWYVGSDHQAERPTKRVRQVHQDPDEYYPISSPHIPATPAIPTSLEGAPDPTLIAGGLFDNFEEFVNLEEIEAEWKRWRECSTEEWVKHADVLAQEYTDILNEIKDHLTEKVMTYAGLVSSVEEKREEVNRNIDAINKREKIVRENISKLGTET